MKQLFKILDEYTGTLLFVFVVSFTILLNACGGSSNDIPPPPKSPGMYAYVVDNYNRKIYQVFINCPNKTETYYGIKPSMYKDYLRFTDVETEIELETTCPTIIKPLLKKKILESKEFNPNDIIIPGNKSESKTDEKPSLLPIPGTNIIINNQN